MSLRGASVVLMGDAAISAWCRRLLRFARNDEVAEIVARMKHSGIREGAANPDYAQLHPGYYIMLTFILEVQSLRGARVV